MSVRYGQKCLLKIEIPKQLADLSNLSFLTGVFPSVLKTAKVVPIFMKDSKLDYSNYRPISLLSNGEKILGRLMYKRLHTILNNNNIIYNLQFGFKTTFYISCLNLYKDTVINFTLNVDQTLNQPKRVLTISCTLKYNAF